MKVRYSRRALTQLASIHDYLRARSRSAPGHVTSSIRDAIARLTEMPSLGKRTDEAGIRVIIEAEYFYRVFYSIEGEVVLVIRILHGRQGH